MIGHRAFNLEDYFALLRRRWWWVLIPAILGPIAGYQVSRKMPSLYKSQTLLVIEVPKVSSNFVTPAVPEYLLMARLGDMEEEILSSSQLRPLLERLGFRGDPPITALKRAISLTPSYSSLDTGDGKLPSGFYITCEFRSAETAQSMCADVASMFMEENTLTQERSARETTAFLTEQLADAKKKLDEQDARLAAFKRQYMGDLPDQVETNLNLLNSATIQLEGVTEALNRAQSDKEYDESLLAQQLAAWDAQQGGSLGSESIGEQISKLENTLTSLEGTYKSDYPDIIDVKAQIAWLSKQAQTERAEAAAKPKRKQAPNENPAAEPPFVQQLRNELRLNSEAVREDTAQRQTLQGQIAVFQSRVQLSPAVEEEYREITRNYQTALDIYNELLRKLDGSVMAGALEQRQDSQQFSIVEPANLPAMPVSPNPQLFAAAGFGLGLILGLAVVLLVEFQDKSIWNERDIESCVQLATLAALPLVEHPRTRLRSSGGNSTRAPLEIPAGSAEQRASTGGPGVAMLPYQGSSATAAGNGSGVRSIPYGTPDMNRVLVEQCVRRSWHPDRDAILLFDGASSLLGTEELRTLRTQLELLRKQQRIHSLLITSPLPTEGKTFTALNLSLAISCQPNRRLLLIDADLRSPQLHRALGTPLTPGLSEYLSGTADELSVIQRGTRSNLFFIPAGRAAINPGDLISNGRLGLLLRHMAPAFDWIIIDSPPAVPVSDAQLLAELCDGVLVIFRAGATPFDLAQRACQQFGEKQLLGVVLNRVKPTKMYNSYYHKLAVEQSAE